MKKTLAALLAALLCTGASVPVSADDRLPGDVNGDGQVNAADAARILEIAASLGAGESIPDNAQNAADLNGDGDANALDAAVLLRYAAASGSGKAQESFAEYMAARNQPPELLGSHCFNTWYIPNRSELPKPAVFSSVAELDAFVRSDETDYTSSTYSAFLKVCEAYDEAWFAEHDLILATLHSGDHDAWFEVTDLTADEQNNWTIHAICHFPNPGSPTDPLWYLMVETNKGVENAASISTHVTGEMYDSYA